MGNQIDKRAKFNGGYIYLRTDKPYYQSGDQVEGKIYLRTSIVLKAKNIQIRINGKEQASFYLMDLSDPYFDQDSVLKKKAQRRIIDFDENCFDFEEDIQPGDYMFNFEFMLPKDLPASIYYLNKDHS